MPLTMRRASHLGRLAPPAIGVGVATAALLALAVAFAPGALAHSGLQRSSPADGDRLAAAPSSVELTFGDAVNPDLARLAIVVDDGRPRSLEPRVTGRRVSAAVPAGLGDPRTKARWRLFYRVVSADGHPVAGAIRFSVEASAAASPTASASASPGDVSPGPAQDTSAGSASAGDGGLPVLLAAGVLALGLAVPGWVLARRRRVRG